MVRLVSHDTTKIVGSLLKTYFTVHSWFTDIAEINNNALHPCVYALWHGHQFGIWAIPDKPHTSIMISNSADGEIVAQGVEMLGFKTVRGSTGRRGSVGATKQLIELLQAGECAAITVDGPRGPARKVKGGIVKIAKTSGAPIVPMFWYSDQFNLVSLNNWDKMTFPVGPTRSIALYGDPIYVDKNLPDEDDHLIIDKIQASLEDLEKRAPEAYKQAKKDKLWTRR